MATRTRQPESASRYQALSALLAVHGANEALKVRSNPLQIIAAIIRYQIMGAILADRGVEQMLTSQGARPRRLAVVNPAAFSTGPEHLQAMLDSIRSGLEADIEARIDRMTQSLIQEASRAAQQVSVTAREDVEWVRHLNLPSCSRCVPLAGRTYRYSQGFQRHPGCDCTMLPVTVAAPDYTYDVEELVRTGQVTDLSKADRQAVAQGADLHQVVNIRRQAAGLTEAGQVLERGGRPTPAGIYRLVGDDREQAIALLTQAGYLT